MPEIRLDNERQLMDRIADGDEAAFTILFRHCIPALEPFILKMTGSEDATREVLQEAFIRVWLKRDTLPSLEKPVHWIFRVASNECFTWLNKEALYRKRYAQVHSTTITANETGIENIAASETAQLIQKAVGKLPAQRRRIYEMSRNEGKNADEIAMQLKLSKSYVKNSLSAALQSIREYLVAAGKVIPLL